MENDTTDHIKNKANAVWDKTKGKTNEVVGEMRHDKGQELKGKAQQIKGNLEDSD